MDLGDGAKACLKKALPWDITKLGARPIPSTKASYFISADVVRSDGFVLPCTSTGFSMSRARHWYEMELLCSMRSSS